MKTQGITKATPSHPRGSKFRDDPSIFCGDNSHKKAKTERLLLALEETPGDSSSEGRGRLCNMLLQRHYKHSHAHAFAASVHMLPHRLLTKDSYWTGF